MASTNAKKNIVVVIKARPLIRREQLLKLPVHWNIEGNSIESNKECLQCPNAKYTFDHIYGENSTTDELYEQVARPIVEESVRGINGCIFAYGQTSSGKTHTMLGDTKNPGIIRIAAKRIFELMNHNSEGRKYFILVNYLEIYNEKVYDLLNKREELKIKESANGEISLSCQGQIAKCDEDILSYVDTGNNHRRVAETKMNVQSSRSHAILQINIQSILNEDGASRVSVLNLVDLAGSERADQTGASGERLKEASNINKSLLTLGIVINKLSDEPNSHIGYRDSKLTRMLQNSLGGNSMTAMICTITPVAAEETNLTLQFATRAKKIENKPIVNETVDDAIQVKRLTKKIVEMERVLKSQKNQIDSFKNNENELKMMKQVLIQAPKPQAIPISNAQRRKTWAGKLDVMQEHAGSMTNGLPQIDPNQGENASSLEDKVGTDRITMMNLKFGDFGRHLEYFNEDELFQSVMNNTIGRMVVDFDDDFNSPQTSKVKAPSAQPARKSLLKTPKSVKNILNRDSITPSLVASPIALDKDKRIRALETELEELRHFQQTESQVCQATVESIQGELNQKAADSDKLNGQLKAVNDKMTTLEQQLVTARSDFETAKTERTTAVKAKILAEQQMVSIEYEYEQFKIRAKRREEELVEQLNNLADSDEIKTLKEKLKTTTEKANTLETQLWNNEKKYQAEIDALKEKNAQENSKYKQTADQIEKLKNLQNEYDELSMQLVDGIQENDNLKQQCATLQATIDTLNSQIDDLKSQVNVELPTSNAQAVDELQTKLQEQSEVHASEVQKMNEDHSKQVDSLTEQLAARSKLIQESEECIAELRKDILELKSAKDEILVESIKEIDDLKQQCSTLQATIDTLNIQIDGLKSQMNVELSMANAQAVDDMQSKLQEQSEVHASELEQLNENHRKEVDSLTEQLAARSELIQESQECIAELRRDIVELESANDDIQKRNDQMEHEYKLMNHKCTHSRITVDSIMKETEVLRHAYNSLLMSMAEQELEHLKLQKTFSELDETMNSMNDVGSNSTINSPHFSRHNTPARVKIEKTDDGTNDVIIELQRTIEEQNSYVNQLDLIKTKILNAIGEDEGAMAIQNDITDMLDKLLSGYSEFNSIKSFLSANEINENIVAIDSQKVIEIIQSGRERSKDILNENASMCNEIKQLKENCNQLQSIKAKNEEMIESLRNKTEQLSTEMEGLKQSNEQLAILQKQLNEKIEEEKSSSARIVSELKGKLKMGEQQSSVLLANKEKELIKQLDDEKSNNQRLMAELNEKVKLVEQMAVLQESNEQLTAKAQELNGQLEKECSNNQRLTAELAEKAKLAEQLEVMQKSNDQFVTKEKLLNEQIETEKTNNAQLMGELKEKQKSIEQIEVLRKSNEQLVTQEKHLIDQLETEKSSNARVVDELNRKLAEHEQREQLLVEQNNELSELKVKQRVEIGRLQQMVSENGNVTVELTKLNKEIDETTEKLRAALENGETLKKALNQKENLLKDKLTQITNLEQEISSSKVELQALQRQIKDLKQTQADGAVQSKSVQNQLQNALSDNKELKEIIANYESMKKEHQAEVNDIRSKLAEMEEEKEKWTLCNEKMKIKVASQIEEITELQKKSQQLSLIEKQMAALKKSNEKAEMEKQELINQMNAMQSKRYGAMAGASVASPRQESKLRNKHVDIDSLMHENRTLHTKQKQMELEMYELRKTTSCGRKIKRRSIHDDTRQISGYDANMHDIEVQTDPVDDKCGCKDMAQQIVKLRQEKVIVESRFAMFKLSTGVDELKEQMEKLKDELSTYKSKYNNLNADYESLVDKYEELKVKSAIASQKPSTNDAYIQTDPPKVGATFVEQMDLQKAIQRAEKYKKAYEQLLTNYNDLKAKYEELGSKFEQLGAKHLEKSNLLEEMQPKYRETKRICNNRLTVIQALETSKAELERTVAALNTELNALKEKMIAFEETTRELDRYKRKYEKAKEICDLRRLEIERLNRIVQENGFNNENLPNNK